MYKLLDGIRILDLTTIVLGPYATQLLGDFGAEVIKIEPPSGDLFRTVRPGRSNEMGAGFLNTNRNKSSVQIDIKSEQGKSDFYKLVEDADVVVHNMRIAAAEKLGISFEALKQIKPDLVFCAAPGFGSDGPYRDRGAYDDVIQAQSGLACLNANEKGEPRFLPTIICDKVGGLHLALAVLAGIAHRLRTGVGCYIEAPMFEASVSFLMVEQLAGRTFDPPMGDVGYERLLSPYRRPFRTNDGYLCVMPYNAAHWQRFLNLIGRDELAESEIVLDSVKRSENVGMLYGIISDTMPSRSCAEWLDEMRRLDIPCAPVNQIADLFEDPHLQEVGFFRKTQHPTEGTVISARSPFRVNGVSTQADAPAPSTGQHTSALLGRG